MVMAGSVSMPAAGTTAMAGGSGGGGTGAAGNSPIRGGEQKCSADDKPETGTQGGVHSGTVHCGLKLLADVPGGGSVQGSGHCAYVRTGGVIKAYSLTDPLKPVQTDEEPTVGSSESMRARTVDGRAILVSGGGVYDISNCEDIVKKGEIAWPSASYQAGLYVTALSGHEVSISHDAKRVCSGVGFAIAHIEDLERPDTWKVKTWTCELNKQLGIEADPNACEGPTQDDLAMGRQYSHSCDDNLDGTVWYGADQLDTSFSGMPVRARMVDISDSPNSVKFLDAVEGVPGHGMNWWRSPDGREFIIGTNEGFGGADSCMDYPRPVDLGNDLDAYIVEVTGNQFGVPFHLSLDINQPENCQEAKASGVRASITEQSVYNENGAAFVMIEYGAAGLRVFDLRDGENPVEVAYYNDGAGHVHSGVFHYEASSGIMLASGSQAMHVLMVQPETIEALGLPTPSDRGYPYK
jgi:hypothetical protein